MTPPSRFGGLTASEHDVLAKYAAAEGHHVDIGTDRGGSACTAAIVKPDPWLVFTIDPNPKMDAETLRTREVAHKIIQIFVKSQEWAGVPGVSTALVDGDHHLAAVMADFEMLDRIGAETILFHDHDQSDTMRVVRTAVGQGWELLEVVEKMAVIRRGHAKV